MLEEIKHVFIEEANELIGNLENYLVDLEKDGVNHETLNSIFRVMHSIKGSASMFGFYRLTDLTHNMETVYDMVRNNHKLLNKNIIDITFDSIDILKGLINDEENISPEVIKKSEKMIEQIVLMSKQIGKPDSFFEEEKKGGKGNSERTFYVRFKPNIEILKTGNNPLFLVDELATMGESEVVVRTDKIPNTDLIDNDLCYLWWEIILTTSQNHEDILGVFLFVEDESDIEIKEIYRGNIFKDGVFSHQEILDLAKKNTPLDLNVFDFSAKNPQNIETNLQNIDSSKKELFPSIRVATNKLDDLINLVSELVTAQDRFQLLAKKIMIPELTNLAEDMSKIARGIRDNAFSIILVPVDSVLFKYKRHVRDLAIELGKEIDFTTEGGDTELDKKIIENLNEPLLHLIRNCADHGIETTEIREKLGKNRAGKISVKAYYSGAYVYIRISDDGAGINVEKVKQHAIEMGIIEPNALLTKAEILSLLFHSGLSTVDKVSEVSGRGVGMDIVNKSISAIKGEIHISSTENVGTTFTIRLPLTLSIVDALLVNIGNTKYMIQIQVIEKIYKIKHEELNASFNDIIILENKPIPYVYLRDFFEYSGDEITDEQIIVVQYEDTKIGLVVDNVVGEYQGVLKDLGKFYKKVEVFTGGSILGDGSIALVIDTNKIIRLNNQKENKVQG